MAGVGHNSVEGKTLTNLIERIETLEEEKQGINDDIKDVYLEAKSKGFDAKTMRKIVRLRKQDPDARKADMALLNLYAEAVALELL